jgi:hypothetical protein
MNSPKSLDRKLLPSLCLRVKVKAPLVSVTAPVSGSRHPGQGYSPRVRVKAPLVRVTAPVSGSRHPGQGYSPRVRVKAPLVRVTAPVSGSRHPWSGLQPHVCRLVQGYEFSKAPHCRNIPPENALGDYSARGVGHIVIPFICIGSTDEGVRPTTTTNYIHVTLTEDLNGHTNT